MKPTIKLIKSWGLGGNSAPQWPTLKHKLVELGVIKSFYDDAPVEWQRAYCKACGRPYPMR